jgi:transporter family protein
LEAKTIVKSGILLAIGTLVALGLADYVRTAAVSRRRVDNMSFMLIETSTWIVVLAIAMLLRGKGFSMSPKLITLPALAGLLSVSGVLALMLALGMEDGSKVVPIGRLSLILTAILSIIILREPLTATKLAGLGFGAFAVVLLSR